MSPTLECQMNPRSVRHVAVRTGLLGIAAGALLGCAGSPTGVATPLASVPQISAGAGSQSFPPTALPTFAPVAAPRSTWGDWEAELTDTTSSGTHLQPLQLSIDWQAGEQTWVQTESMAQELLSTSVAANDGEIRLIATDSTSDCATGAEGRYRWERPADGLFLKLTLITDACAYRGKVLGRTWVHSLGAVNDGGPGVLGFGPAWMQVTMPREMLALGGGLDAGDLHNFHAEDQAVTFATYRNPMGFTDPCALVPSTPQKINPGVDAIAAYIRALPGAAVKTTTTQISGYAAVHLELETDPKSCGGGELGVFRSRDSLDQNGIQTVEPGASESIWVFTIAGDSFVLWYRGADGPPADEQAVILSIRLTESLPKP